MPSGPTSRIKSGMNANFGIVLRKNDREPIFLKLPPRVRTWGQEIFEIEKCRYIFPGLDGRHHFDAGPSTPDVTMPNTTWQKPCTC